MMGPLLRLACPVPRAEKASLRPINLTVEGSDAGTADGKETEEVQPQRCSASWFPRGESGRIQLRNCWGQFD